MTMTTLRVSRGFKRSALMALSVAVLTSGCGRQPSPASQATPAAPAGGAPAPVAVDLVRVVEQPLDVQLSLPGELLPYEAVDLHARVAGFVKTVTVDRGSTVRRGDVLATLDAPEVVAQRAEAQSKLQSATAQLAAARARADADQATFERLTSAAATPGVVAGNDVVVAGKTADASRHQVLAAEQQVEAARQAAQAVQELEGYLRVTAPFAGIITERHVHPGALVGPGASAATPMLRLVDQRRLRLVAPIPEAYTASLARDITVPFTVSAFPGTTFTGTVARIARAVDVTTRTMAVELDVDNADGRLSAGTFCQMRWPLARSTPSLFVPAASVASTTDRTFVVRVREGKAEWVNVTTGLSAGALVEVFGDLKAGDEVAGRGTDELRPGTAVTPRVAKPTA